MVCQAPGPGRDDVRWGRRRRHFAISRAAPHLSSGVPAASPDPAAVTGGGIGSDRSDKDDPVVKMGIHPSGDGGGGVWRVGVQNRPPSPTGGNSSPVILGVRSEHGCRHPRPRASQLLTREVFRHSSSVDPPPARHEKIAFRRSAMHPLLSAIHFPRLFPSFTPLASRSAIVFGGRP